ncbi:UDP-glycosyltransferase 75C1-like [Ipomoea triloba]|uniref:UDP-glycosyltransferase 75C1-like n=1 Tax=Ipomoea triloba TaxID=35885 RepID=UPI00125CF629|nr:UDP-glycosyltransferase 75C1-like [Ipomoea triloba]
MEEKCHVLLAVFPAQGQLNPSLQFAKRLVKMGVKVTFSTSSSAINSMSNRPEIQGLELAPYSDGFDGQFQGVSVNDFWASVKTKGTDALADLIAAKNNEAKPFTRIIYTTAMAWAGLVARRFQLPFTLLWIQPKQGKIVHWCGQVEVLQHPSVGCFFTHCGWNSMLECLTSGVPVVACPVWNDQLSNAKLVQDVWKSGVRVGVNEEGVVTADEFKRCIECVMGGGENGEELRKNAKKWKDLAKAATKEDGSSYLNLKAYIDEMLRSP